MLEFLSDVDFVSEHGNVRVHVPRVGVPRNLTLDGQRPTRNAWRYGLAALSELVRRTKSAGASLTPVGSGWSQSQAVRPIHWLVETKHLNEVIQLGVPESHVSRGYLNGGGLVFVQAGNTLARLSRILADKGRSLATVGGGAGQTIAGAISMGTHGSAFDTPGIHDSVVGLHVVGKDGADYWLERASKPIVADPWIELIGTQLVRDDELFNAAVVGLGGLGVIHAVLLETRPLFLLERQRLRHDSDALLQAISLGTDGVMRFPQSALPQGRNRLYHFSVVINPNDKKSGDAFVDVIYEKGRAGRDYAYADRSVRAAESCDDAASFVSDFIGLFGSKVSSRTRRQLDELAAVRFSPSVNGETGALGELFPRMDLHPGGIRCEIGVDVVNARRAVQVVLDAIHSRDVFPGVLCIRFTRQSAATLAYTRFAGTCTIELAHVQQESSAALHCDIWRGLKTQHIPFTLHWGGSIDFRETSVRSMYGDARVDSWCSARQRFLGDDGRFFMNRLLADAGLDA